jgi:Na+/glutamate symporter
MRTKRQTEAAIALKDRDGRSGSRLSSKKNLHLEYVVLSLVLVLLCLFVGVILKELVG